MSEHRWLDDVPAYVLGALDSEEYREFESHLAACPICQTAVGEHEGVATALGGLVPEVEPPEHLREEIVSAALATGSAGHETDGSVTELKTRRPAGPSVLPWLLAAAAIAFLVVHWVNTRQALEANETTLAVARERILELEIAQAQRDSMLLALVGSGVRTATLTATGGEPQVRLFWNRQQQVLLLTAFDLPAAPTGRTYQLWGLAPDQNPVSLGVFDTDGGGGAVSVRSIAGSVDFAQSAVSVEPAGGSPQPTTTPFLIGDFSAGP